MEYNRFTANIWVGILVRPQPTRSALTKDAHKEATRGPSIAA